MHIALPVLLLVATVLAVSALARRVGLSAPLLLTAVGAAVSFLPGFPVVEVDPEVVLLGFLPPLLFVAASETSLIDLRRERRQILGLSVGLVLFTAFGVALVAAPLLDLPFAAALALGAVVAPPDAVAATAVARRIGLPRRVVSILEGESLFNDATALVTLKTALLATAGTVTAAHVGLDFLRAALGGALVGVVAFLVIGRLRRHLTDVPTSVVLSYMSPWLAYLPAEAIHASGVIAAVVCGVLLAHKAPWLQTAQSRVAERMSWSSVQMVLENLVFLLIGLQTATITRHVVASDLGFSRVLLVSLAVLAAVMLLRPLWLLGWSALGLLGGRGQGRLGAREAGVAGWAGMRGVVTLAAAFTITTEQVPQRDVLVFVALVVTIGTLVLQGFSLGTLARRLGLHAPDPREDALARAHLVHGATRAGLARLDEELAAPDCQPVPAGVQDALRTQAHRRSDLAWEQLGRRDPQTETPTTAYRRLRLAMIDAERTTVLTVRSRDLVDAQVLDGVLRGIDVEESMLVGIDTAQARESERMLQAAAGHAGGCADLQEAPTVVDPSTREDVCAPCREAGMDPVHLRMCLTCGNIACCDSSPGRHASAHAREHDHPVVRSWEPGEAWRWCYRHELLG